ncbi:MAG: hypothetical protein HFI76_05750 [Lachnospiraceae bacterium]|nr:hypothetical protein [Lachnospiraceae bacterium]
MGRRMGACDRRLSTFFCLTKKGRLGVAAGLFLVLAGMLSLVFGFRAQGAEPEQIEYYYENVCASCDGTEDFYSMLQERLSKEEQKALQGKTAAYNVFLDSCREQYEERVRKLGIPEGTSLPVLIVGDRWVSGLEQMEELLREAAGKAADHSGPAEGGLPGEEQQADGSGEKKESKNSDLQRVGEHAADQKEADLAKCMETELESQEPALLLFTTESCEDCEKVKEWLAEQKELTGGRVLEYNIVKEPCLNILKGMFREYGLGEQDQKVPALFYGNGAATGAEAIFRLDGESLWEEGGNQKLLSSIRTVKQQLPEEEEAAAGGQNLLTLVGAGLLAGLNPCSISMFLMLLSMVVAEKASVWKNGLLYLTGKYAAYVTIGMAIYTSAANLDGLILQDAGNILNGILVLLFGAAGILYLADAVRVFRQEYGKIRTQLPAGLRKWNHGLIRRVGNYSGILKPLLILGLGMAISVGEFFCTGQIYMASITYLLKDQVAIVWVYFLVYVTAMSLPAFLMLIIIQRTRNTELISEFMLRHMGAVKIFNALLFLGYAVYFVFS